MFAVDERDLTLMSLNLFGLRTGIGDGRARMEARITADPSRSWHLILATGQRTSPFELVGSEITDAAGRTVAQVELVEHDDARLGYPRAGGRVLTANTNRRSTCTGCVFCPNTLADSSDPRMATEDLVHSWVDGVLLEQGWTDFAHVEEVNLSTGCFGTEARALAHLTTLRRVLDDAGFRGRLGILTSVLRTQDGMRAFADTGRAAVFLTMECVTRRELVLKESKADLTPAEGLRVLERARAEGVDTGAMLVVGLDPLAAAGAWLDQAAPMLTDFPNLQIYQAHTPYMEIFREPGAESIDFFVEARQRLEASLANSDVRPEAWSNFRPLWYYTYQGSELVPDGMRERAAV